MKSNKINLLWTVSLIVIAVSGILLLYGSLSGQELPDTLVRVCGILSLASLAVFGFTTVLKLRK